MGKGTKVRSKDHQITFRVSRELYESLAELAEKEQRNLSQMARVLVENGILQHERLLDVAERDREWTAYWHAALPEADADVAAGRVMRYDDLDSLLAMLDAVPAKQADA